jgi:hypothetical protein
VPDGNFSYKHREWVGGGGLWVEFFCLIDTTDRVESR